MVCLFFFFYQPLRRQETLGQRKHPRGLETVEQTAKGRTRRRTKKTAKTASTTTREQVMVTVINSTVNRNRGSALGVKINSKSNKLNPVTGPEETVTTSYGRVAGVCRRIGETDPRPNPRRRRKTTKKARKRCQEKWMGRKKGKKRKGELVEEIRRVKMRNRVNLRPMKSLLKRIRLKTRL